MCWPGSSRYPGQTASPFGHGPPVQGRRRDGSPRLDSPSPSPQDKRSKTLLTRGQDHDFGIEIGRTKFSPIKLAPQFNVPGVWIGGTQVRDEATEVVNVLRIAIETADDVELNSTAQP